MSPAMIGDSTAGSSTLLPDPRTSPHPHPPPPRRYPGGADQPISPPINACDELEGSSSSQSAGSPRSSRPALYVGQRHPECDIASTSTTMWYAVVRGHDAPESPTRRRPVVPGGAARVRDGTERHAYHPSVPAALGPA